MPIVGIDPGVKLGFAVVNRAGEIMESAEVDVKGGLEPLRLLLAAAALRELGESQGQGPMVCAIEQAWLGKNTQTALAISRMIGRLQEVAERAGFTVYLVQPNEWRPAVGIEIRRSNKNIGRLSLKSQAIAVVRRRTGLMVRSDNVAEAILLGQFIAGELRMGQLVARKPA